MKPLSYFTPGPAALYPTVPQHLQKALEEQIPSISHRSPRFSEIYQETYEYLKEIFQLPDDYAVLFTGSATEIWERLLMNCVEEEPFHLVNGSFSNRFHQTAELLQKKPKKHEVPFGQGFLLPEIDFPSSPEFIALTHNETSAGVTMPVSDIHQIKDQFPKSIVAVDMVSSAPYPVLNYNKVDSAFFSVQKAFGLPAGLGVWLVNEKCLAKAESLESKGLVTGTYHRLTNMWKYFKKFQTPCTPNVLSIYLLGQVAKDMLQRDIGMMRQEIASGAQAIYKTLANTEGFEIFVQNEAHRSDTVIVANTSEESSQILGALAQANLVVGSGYGEYKEKQIRIANFPANTIWEFTELIQKLAEMEV